MSEMIVMDDMILFECCGDGDLLQKLCYHRSMLFSERLRQNALLDSSASRGESISSLQCLAKCQRRPRKLWSHPDSEIGYVFKKSVYRVSYFTISCILVKCQAKTQCEHVEVMLLGLSGRWKWSTRSRRMQSKMVRRKEDEGTWECQSTIWEGLCRDVFRPSRVWYIFFWSL